MATVVAVCALLTGGCGATPPSPNAPSGTTTGLLPSGVPTEGTRPDADGLPSPAEPQQAPPPLNDLPGRQVRVGTSPEGVVVDPVTRRVAIASREPNELVLLDADSGTVSGRSPLPGFARHLQLAAPGGPVLVPVESADTLVRVDLPNGAVRQQILTGTFPHDAAQAGNGIVFVANEHGGTVAALRGDDIVMVFTDSVQPAGLAPTGSVMGLLDVRKNDLTVYDVDSLAIVGSTPAGAGPTHLVADKHGRLIAADTRGDAVRVFTALPEPREVASVVQPGGPYGITYDEVRDRVWVASSGANEVVGYDMTQQTPREVARIPTLQNPYTLGVDARTGRLFVAGTTSGNVQIIDPQE
ncbi:YncE family protein [Mycobacterium sp. MS1601]|uniref:YncE family protein n=1 Tax=Mycobacterium sp. MS1601 TaxID=1936029 RepID=UPI001F38BD86|nr:YncE family protein [Mycobacterium sp. MS1601]